MKNHVMRLAAAPFAILALAACASETPVAPEAELSGPAFSVSNDVGFNAITNTAGFGTGDKAVIGVAPSRLNAIQVQYANGSQWCRSNGPGDDPGAGSLRAIYEDANGNPAALAYMGSALKVYSRIAGVGNFVCQNLNAKVGGDNIKLGQLDLPTVFPNAWPFVYVVQNEANGRVEFRRDGIDGPIIGRTNGAGDNGTLIAGWIGSDGRPYALIGRGNATNGEYRVITPTFVNVGIFPVNTVGRVVH
ncbi:MAG: hypothetical protein INH04_04550 [Gemmatimonas sp.]|nr:hypothetical protein [Gemmatimonas sp.]